MNRSWIRSVGLAVPFIVVGCATKSVVEPPMTVRDLRKEVDPVVRWTPTQVPDEKNGWKLMIEATKSVLDVKKAPISPTLTASKKPQPNLNDFVFDPEKASAEDVQTAQDLIRRYEPAFALVDQAMAKPIWARPEPRDDIAPNPAEISAELFPEFAPMKGIVRARGLRARLRYFQGDTEGAANDLIASARFGTRIASSDGPLIQSLVGIACETISYRNIQELAPLPKWTVPELNRMLAELPARKGSDRFARTLRYEFDRFTLRYIAGIRATPDALAGLVRKEDVPKVAAVFAASSHPLDRKATIREASKIYKELVLNASRPYSSHVNVDTEIERLTSMWPPSLLSGGMETEQDGTQTSVSDRDWSTARNNASKTTNPMGKYMLALVLPVFTQAEIADRKSLGSLGGTRVALATALYRRVHHAEPPDLAALVKEGFLSARPIDPFSEKPLRYSAEQKLTWSIGPNPGSDEAGDPLDRNSHPRGYAWPTNGVTPKSKIQP